MQLDRRTMGSLALGAMVGSTGCLGFLSGTTTVAADQAVVANGADEDAGYEKARTQDLTVERTFSGGGQERTVEVTNWVVEYQKTVSVAGLVEQKAAVFATFTSPEVSVLGQSFNPLSKLSTKDFAKRMQDQYSGLSVGEEVKSSSVSIAGESTSCSQFEGTATFNGQQMDVYIVVSEPVKHEGDYVVAMAVYPRDLDGEYETVLGLMENVEHPVTAGD